MSADTSAGSIAERNANTQLPSPASPRGRPADRQGSELTATVTLSKVRGDAYRGPALPSISQRCRGLPAGCVESSGRQVEGRVARPRTTPTARGGAPRRSDRTKPLVVHPSETVPMTTQDEVRLAELLAALFTGWAVPSRDQPEGIAGRLINGTALDPAVGPHEHLPERGKVVTAQAKGSPAAQPWNGKCADWRHDHLLVLQLYTLRTFRAHWCPTD